MNIFEKIFEAVTKILRNSINFVIYVYKIINYSKN